MSDQTLIELKAAAQAVIDRWDSPSWKDLPATADYIHRLRKAMGDAGNGAVKSSKEQAEPEIVPKSAGLESGCAQPSPANQTLNQEALERSLICLNAEHAGVAKHAIKTYLAALPSEILDNNIQERQISLCQALYPEGIKHPQQSEWWYMIERVRDLALCYELLEVRSEIPVIHPALANAAEILTNFKGEGNKLEEWQACYAKLFKQMNDICMSIRLTPNNARD